MAGLALLVLAFFAPDSSHHHDGSFFKLAINTNWRHVLDLPAAWCSLKIIFLSVGLFLICEAVGTKFARRQQREFAVAVYCLEILPAACFALGVFLLVKSLL